MSLTKPIVAVKSGRSTQGIHRATGPAHRRCRRLPSTTSTRQSGVIQVDTLSEMFDVAQILTFQPLPRGGGSPCARQQRRPSFWCS